MNKFLYHVQKFIKNYILQCLSIDGEPVFKSVQKLEDNLKKCEDNLKKCEDNLSVYRQNWSRQSEALNLLEGKFLRCQNLLNMYILNGFLSTSSELLDVNQLIACCQKPIGVFDKASINETHKGLQILFRDKLRFLQHDSEFPDFDLAYLWGLKPWYEQSRVIVEAKNANIPIFMLEDGFIRSVVTWNNTGVEAKYRHGHSFTVDDKTIYINANQPSRLEMLLNSDLELTEEQCARAKFLINKIVEAKISKYNHQPILEPKLGREKCTKVLVVDQSYGDMSVKYGWADDETFKNMLQCAIAENPDADIIIKTHPDAKANTAAVTGYYQTLEANDNVYKITCDINPISLLEYVDKVYVCTTQMGFEALLCNKEVHVFGMPFYAGWGVTHDSQVCRRRKKRRSIEEIFFIAYIMYSKYVSFKTGDCCEIEQVIDDILELREEYFEFMGDDSN